jgi:Na+-translocating ferredoxin:NAD+ oxidoreductase subunit B
MNTIVITIISLSVIGGLAGVILYLIARKFRVYEDPRIDEVESVLPGANCGGCGYPGCRGFAEACVKAEDLDILFCPVGGNDGMLKVAETLGKVATAKDPEVAVIRCSGSPEHRQRLSRYDGAATCEIAAALYSGDTGCSYGCLGMGIVWWYASLMRST